MSSADELQGAPIAVIGAGAMGAGIAQVAAVAGHQVSLLDARDGVAQAAIDKILATLEKLVAKQRVTPEQVQQARKNLRTVESTQDCSGCKLVIEAIVEDLAAKQKLFCDLEAICGDGAIFATNTSSISITAIASALKNPSRLAGMHFFNPAPIMSLVEIISGAATAPQVVDKLYALAEQWGKSPVRAASTPGFIVNRIARPFYGEALRLLNEGAADCATLDSVLREAGGFRMGPFELMDLIGMDVNYAVTRSVFDAFYGDPRFAPSLQQKQLVDAGFLGRKSGRGFFDYADGAAKAEPVTVDAQPTPVNLRIYGDESLVSNLALKLAIEKSGAHPDGRIAESGDFTLYQTDGRSATLRAAESGIANTVLVDLALDYGNAKRVAITVADQAGASAGNSAAGLLQAAGYAVSRVDDVPGMVVMRTVAMLANEAADAVNQRVCSAADADLAMRKGVNYPRGPLEWADAIGLPIVVTVLDNLSHAYGEDRYRVSPLLRRKALTGTKFHETEPGRG